MLIEFDTTKLQFLSLNFITSDINVFSTKMTLDMLEQLLNINILKFEFDKIDRIGNKYDYEIE